MEDLLFELMRQGGFAFVAGIAIWFAWRKDKQNEKLYSRLEWKTDKYVEQYSKLTNELNQTLSALADSIEIEKD